jgi:methionine-S-sulfoxide reductase
MITKCYLSGGCFWHIQKHFNNIKGVIRTFVGYSNGNVVKPTYENVCTGDTGHIETIKIIYNSKKISFSKLCEELFKIHDYTLEQKVQYQSTIFFLNNYQKNEARKIIDKLENCKTKILKFKNFYKAEKYHQNYL